MRFLVLDNPAGDWRRLYADGDLLAEGPPARVQLPKCDGVGDSVVFETMEDDFDLLADYIGDDE